MRWYDVDLGPGVRAGFTGADANLSVVVGDRDLALGHRRALADLVGGPVTFVRQVHGATVLEAPLPGGVPGTADDVPYDGVPAADALVARRGAAVGVLVADCVPVLLADARAGVVAAVHAGRCGLVDGVVPAAVAAMVARGAEAGGVRAAVGPAVCGRCYEVPPALRDDVAAAVPATPSTTSWGTPALDLPAGVRAQLRAAGVADVRAVGGCTLEDARWFSHRAASAGLPGRAAGRFAGVVRIA
ncbi:polyphenol oxidase family protein [Actinotalea solisilvae]|uniref:polyphenol oxidase family protein n=1 Tax=Actinotalea solisilvae TaxID=2072922 RepID=UPI0018F14EC8|nr:polyphenol oxidase family protein [Actinotalea solisilvae]